MKSRFVISENDRRSILSMYGLLTEQVKKTISGKVVRFGYYSDIISNTPAPNVKVDLLKLVSLGDIDELSLVDTQETDMLGTFKFEGLDSFENLIIRSNENDFYEEKELNVPNKKENEQEITIQVKFKENKEQKNIDQTIKEPCHNYTSDKKTFYGKAKSEKFNPNDDKYVYDQIVIDAKIDALKQYFIIYNVFFDIKDELIEKIKKEDSIKFKIVCSERILNEKNISVKYITVKINKEDLDNFTKEKPKDETPKVEKINFQNINFRDLIKKSKDENKFAFILMTNFGEVVSEDILNRLNINQEMVNKINSDYIAVNYINDESDKEGYVLASNTLNVYTIPSILVIKGIKDPYPISGSFRIISKNTDFSDYFNDFTNYLERVNNLIK